MKKQRSDRPQLRPFGALLYHIESMIAAIFHYAQCLRHTEPPGQPSQPHPQVFPFFLSFLIFIMISSTAETSTAPISIVARLLIINDIISDNLLFTFSA
jgi:hypothetical protein